MDSHDRTCDACESNDPEELNKPISIQDIMDALQQMPNK
jgi:hypothetical protein